MSNKLSKKNSEVKHARFERKHLCNHSTYHQVVNKAFHKAQRREVKHQLKRMV